ncbi:MBL fold metallo-hydrolase [Kutzneria viridogrisea]|uniref:MBL fold metallo-hydrolase n=1 Tax=Kutzneria viridogrisea TaxID=47990 RepID=UPI00046D5BE1
MRQIVLGDVSVTRVGEYYGSVHLAPQAFFPEAPDGAWLDHKSWLAPDFWDTDANHCMTAVQTWLLRSEGSTILVDTGVGNHKERPDSPLWTGLRTSFLEDLATAGARPEDVDIVINTHLHADHVGWNTRLDGTDWVPTFPNATYLIPEREFHRWNPEGEHYDGGNQNVFEDSVTPVHRAGQVRLWDLSHRIDKNLRLDLAPGHTPGSSVVTLESGTDRAVFVGDMMHNPLQFVEPDTNSCFCEDQAEARATRHKVLGWAADNNALVLPAHLGGQGGAEIVRDGGKFAIKQWAPFARI